MAWIAPVVGGIGAVAGLFGRPKRRDNRKAIAALRAARPVGYLTPEDQRAAELTRGRLVAGANVTGELAGYGVTRRSRARGLAGSPSEERDLARVSQQTAAGREAAGTTAEEQLYNIRTGREAFEQQKELTIFGAETGANLNEQARQDAQQAEFWNSTLGLIDSITQSIPKRSPTTGAAATTVRGYSPGMTFNRGRGSLVPLAR